MTDRLTQGPPPTWRESVTYRLRDLVGYGMAKTLMDAADYTPLGAVFASNEAGAKLRDGRKGAAALGLGGALLAGLPLPAAKVSGKVARAAKKALAMDEASRMARAARQGYKIDAYHGGTRSFDSFDPTAENADLEKWAKGTWVSASPETASEYAIPQSSINHPVDESVMSDRAGANVMPLLVNKKTKLLDVKDFHGLQSWETVGQERLKAAQEYALANGYDGLKYKGAADKHPDGAYVSRADQYLIFDPTNIRSKFAAFDPAKRKSANLLAGIGGAGIAVPLTIGQMSQQRQGGGI